MKNWIPEIIWSGVIIFLSLILQKDVISFWQWWLTVEILGLAAMPLSARLFRNFEDRGWMFSKVIGIAGAGFLTWWLVSLRLLRFTTFSALLVCGICIVCAAASWYFFPCVKESLQIEKKHLIFAEEAIFLLVFLMWTYLAGFHAQAQGTEKFMDYGFMEAMMRSTVLPARDLWYSEGHINYYYGGQYFAVFLTKISGTEVRVTYNLMRTFLAGLAFVLPFSLVYQMTCDCLKKNGEEKRKIAPVLAALTAGTAVSIAGNMHYVVYCLGMQLRNLLFHTEEIGSSSYWFPDATRYIGYQPDVPDKTIHEFPCYSFVLGDLHAHVVNIMFVLLVLGLLYAFTSQKRAEVQNAENTKAFYRHEILNPQLLMVSVLLGMFQWTNFWDYVIYFVVCGGTVLFTNIIIFEGDRKKIFSVTFLQAVEVLVVSYLIIIPFTLQFVSMVDGIALAQHHSLPHQLLILWGLPCFLTILFIGVILYEKLVKAKPETLSTFMESVCVPDLFAVITGLCAIGLVLIPEIVYVRDIYENGNARANTMFKLTYQAYIMFGITMGYVIYRMLVLVRSRVIQGIVILGLFCLILTCGYFGNCVKSWYGNVWDMNQYEGLDATAYMDYLLVEDAGGIRWLKENVTDVSVVLEANGDSYQEYHNRVSAMTGLPTILGWYVHEWLWRNNTDDLNIKTADIERIFTSEEEAEVENLLHRYGVSYIFVGSEEKLKYGDRLNHELLRNLGQIVFEDELYGTYIVQVIHG